MALLPRSLAATLAATTLVAGCSLLPGDDEKAGPVRTTAAGDGPLSSIGWSPVSADDVAAGGTLRLATSALPRNFNPQHTSNAESDVARVIEPTTGSAVRVTADGGWEVDTDYARSVEVVDSDPLTIEVELNPRAVWQGGTPITAQDMVAFWRAQNGSDDSYRVLSTEGYEDIEAVEPGDDEYSYTVRFEDPTTDWPRFVYPRLPANVSSSAKLFNSAFTGRSVPSNGPYRVAGIDRDTGRVVQEPNPRWWGDRPRLESIVWQAATPQAQLEQLQAGDLDAVDVPAALQADARAADLGDDVVLRRSAGTEWTHLTMNGAAGPLKDVEVRRAVASALDRRAIAAATSRPVGAPPAVLGSFVLLPGQRGYVDQSALLTPDATEAAAMLDDAGWKLEPGERVRSRKGKPLELTMPVPAATSTNRARARMIADQLAEVGIEVRLTTVPDADFFTDRIIPLDFDLATFTHTGSAFPVVDGKALFYPIDSGQNFTGVEDDELAGAWDKGIAALDDDERSRVVSVLDKRLFRDVPLIPLGVTPEAALVDRSVVNYGPSQFARPDWTVVGLDTTTDD